MQEDKLECKTTQSFIKMLPEENLINIQLPSSSRFLAQWNISTKMKEHIITKPMIIMCLKHNILSHHIAHDSLDPRSYTKTICLNIIAN